MNNVLSNKEHPILFFMLPSMILFMVSVYNLLGSFSLIEPKNIFLIISSFTFLYSLSFLGDFLERTFICNSRFSLISIVCFIASIYVMLDNDFLSKLISNLYIKNSISSYLLLYISFLSHIINSIFTVIFCISLIIFIPQIFLGSIFSYFTSNKISFSIYREIALIFVLTLSFKSICLMLIEEGF